MSAGSPMSRAHLCLLVDTQVTVSTYSRIRSFAMKGNGEEGRHTVRNVCGLFLQPPPHRWHLLGELGAVGGSSASHTGPSCSHCCRGKAISCSTKACGTRRPHAALVAGSEAKQGTGAAEVPSACHRLRGRGSYELEILYGILVHIYRSENKGICLYGLFLMIKSLPALAESHNHRREKVSAGVTRRPGWRQGPDTPQLCSHGFMSAWASPCSHPLPVFLLENRSFGIFSI